MFELLRLQLRTAHMLAEAQTVFGLRMMGLAGILPASSGENLRMVTEKQKAFTKAGMAAAGVMMAGGSPAQVYGAALTPIGRITRANSRRLSRRRA